MPGLLVPLSILLSTTVWGADLPSFNEVKSRTARSEGVLLDRNREVLHERRIQNRSRQLEWTRVAEVSSALKDAVLFAEDRRFREHRGVDWGAFLKSAAGNLFSRNLRGASTIAMQTASLLDRELAPKKTRRNFTQKMRQIAAAIDLEKRWSKDEILEAYLNLVSFRGELRGIRAASLGLFRKAPHGLNFEESLILASLIRSPEASIAAVENRACELGKEMRREFQCEALHALLELSSLRPQLISSQASLAPHLAAHWLKTAEVVTTLDRALQKHLFETLRRQVLSIRNKNAHDAAGLVLDNRTGDVLAYVGGVGDLSSAQYVDGVRAFRQAGSTLKPFLFGLGVDRRYLNAATILDDSPLDIPVLNGVYRPKNYDHEFRGEVSVRVALASSLNVPAVKTLELIGVGDFVRILGQLGFQDLREAEYYGPSLALGSADVTLWDLTNAYRSLANRGIWNETRLLATDSKAGLKRKVFSPEAAFVIASILSDRDSRSTTFGLENPLSSRFWTAVKTGTSKDMRDNWCIGFSERYTVGIWVGNFSGEPMWNISGVSGAAPAWAEVMKWLHSRRPSHPPEVPSGVVFTQGEWFLKGTEPGLVLGSDGGERGGAYFKITYPANGTMIAMDPDIPSEHQRVFFQARPAVVGLSWVMDRLDPHAVIRVERGVWKPEPGNYRLSLVDTENRILDAVQFSVRGQTLGKSSQVMESPDFNP